MTFLIAFASRYGGTVGVAEAIGEGLAAAGVEADLLSLDEPIDLSRYEAVILVSAVYFGRWLAEARAFVEERRDALRRLPLWLVSSGPVGHPPFPREPSGEVEEWKEALGAREHKVFGGRIVRRELGVFDRFFVGFFRAAEGDYRDLDAVRAWAEGVAGVLTSRT